MSKIFSFPSPVNEKAARTVAVGVVAMGIAFVVTGWTWLLIPLTYGFLARVASGPTLSPLGQIATRLVAPRLGEPKLVAGPPKRFAQLIGALFTVTASILVLAGAVGAAQVVIGLLVVAAGLEGFGGVCLGCIMFGQLMKVGVIPESVCLECADLSQRYPQLADKA
jgi:hypothetical protein